MKERAWNTFRDGPPPVGFDPATIWPGGPEDPGAAVIRLDPWRLKAADAATLAAGGEPLTWRRPSARHARELVVAQLLRR